MPRPPALLAANRRQIVWLLVSLQDASGRPINDVVAVLAQATGRSRAAMRTRWHRWRQKSGTEVPHPDDLTRILIAARREGWLRTIPKIARPLVNRLLPRRTNDPVDELEDELPKLAGLVWRAAEASGTPAHLVTEAVIEKLRRRVLARAG